MKRYLCLWIVLQILGCAAMWADEAVTFTASAPEAVVVGDHFRLSFTVTSQQVRDFKAPTIRGFEVLMGPHSSRQSSTEIINGKVTQSSSITFTYTLLAQKEGEFSIPGATIVAAGKPLVSNSLQIRVLPADKSAGAGSQGSSSQRGMANSGTISNNDLMIISSVSKSNVYEQEAFLLTYKIYTAVDLRGFDNIKLPDFNGFHSQEVEQPSDRRWKLEHYKGRNYQTTIYRQFILFPQQSGELTIEGARFDASIAQASQVTDPFEALFNGGGVVEVKKSIFTPKITMHVSALPSGKPEGYSGGVGEFNISSSISATEVKTNDAITLKLVVSGTGNLKLVANPEVNFPETFEVYDPKDESKFKLSSDGLTGNKVIEYLAIPRSAGTFKIPAVTFGYFDIKSKSYKTLATEEYTIQVAKGEGNAAQSIANFTNKENLQVLNEDIRFIKQGATRLTPRGEYFFGTMAYWLWYILPAFAFVLFVVLYRKQIAANANVVKTRTKKANKVAVKRMKQAGKLLSENKKDAFFDEVLKALWGYVSDKLNIPVSQLSKDNIEEALRSHQVAEELIKEFINTLNECEFARFAPGDPNQAMDKVYKASLSVIGEMENQVKH